MAVELLPLGAAVRSLWVPDKGGNPTDVVLGYESLEEYRELDGCLGGTLGRCANRIGGARFAIGGREYRLTANEGTGRPGRSRSPSPCFPQTGRRDFPEISRSRCATPWQAAPW